MFLKGGPPPRQCRQIIRTAYDPFYRRALERQQSRRGKRMKRLRQRTVEPVLGSLVDYYGLRKINVRGKDGAKTALLTGGKQVLLGAKTKANTSLGKRELVFTFIARRSPSTMSQDPTKLKVTHSVFNKHPTNYQSNLFTESRQEFTELEKKIVVLVVNQIGHMALKGELKPDTNVKFHIPYTELTKDRYNLISEAADTLQQKRLMYRSDDGEKFHYIVPFPSVKSDTIDGRKVIVLTMFAEVVPHFAELGQRYTKNDIAVMLSLSSVYAQRMFEVASMFINRGQKQFTYGVDELRYMLNCPETYRYNDFTINALGVAQRELQRKADLNLEWQPSKKEGKRVTELLFTIKTARQIAADDVEKTRQVIPQLAVHEAVRQAHTLMAVYKLTDWQKDQIISTRDLLNEFFRVHTELTNGLRPNIKNHTAYLVKSLALEKKKAQSKAELPVNDASKGRSSEVKSIGSIFNLMQLEEKWK